MRVAIVGSGPAGLTVGALLARRGHQVVSVDRDPGPSGPGRWERRGVMQFHHAHGVRPQVGWLLEREWPEAMAAWTAAGAEPITMDIPGMGHVPAGHRSRRETFERGLRAAAVREPGLTLRRGHVDRVAWDGRRVTGLVVEGGTLEADLVVDASGRSGRAADRVRGPAEIGGVCGLAYVDREYQLRRGVEPGPMVNPIAWQADFDGYQAIVFLHERGRFSVLLVRPTSDPALRDLRHAAAFEAACRAVPGLAEWTDPDRSRPVGEVLPGGELRNAYRGQGGLDGSVTVPGLLSVGDAVATTTPTFGRGLATTFLQLGRLVGLLDEGYAVDEVAEPFDAWCREQMWPWVADHLHMDGDQVRRWEGGGLDLSQPRLPSDRILAASEVDGRIGAAMGGYLAMTALPASLDPVEPLARAVYETGWRPAYSPGPGRDELVEILRGALSA